MNASQEPSPHQPGEHPSPEAGGTVGYGTPPPASVEGGYGLAHPSGPVGFARSFSMRMSERRPWKRTLAVTVICALVILALGGPLGLLWRALAPDVPVINTGQGGIVVNDPSPEEFIAADGWFTLLGLGFGLLVSIVAWLVLRRDRGPFLLLSVVLGTLGAGWLVAPWAGELMGRSGYESWMETAQRGATYMAPPEVHSLGPTLVPAFAAAIVLTLMAGWSNDPDLDHPGAKPGYGPNSEYAEGLPAEGYPQAHWSGTDPAPGNPSSPWPGDGTSPAEGYPSPGRPGSGGAPTEPRG
ncbi:hypothetical protein JIG36_06885 [Actinoplanes sp. LDG1-06]|uniref:DUF2567 domain-containing protein n=1 Tax=Paractinoplanes ovalisporus TaxID=2810368 RepID=A0ABS2A636_9ACTN|nr:hypothetical protein [Actinoplanes ovalisporus]MBM2615286.1 hypothetical protein [Actinoplanes ovalisporus]